MSRAACGRQVVEAVVEKVVMVVVDMVAVEVELVVIENQKDHPILILLHLLQVQQDYL